MKLTSDFLLESVDDSYKKKQLAFILKHNPMIDDIHTGIRTLEDIKTASEAFEDAEVFTPDFNQEDMNRALQSGWIVMYSSKPFTKGCFVTPSRMEAKSYAGSGQVYQKKVPLTHVAWIDEGQGQYTPIL